MTVFGTQAIVCNEPKSRRSSHSLINDRKSDIADLSDVNFQLKKRLVGNLLFKLTTTPLNSFSDFVSGLFTHLKPCFL